ncbi:unnamed protein product [Caenorhabditis auriculariae]|uniref:Uncharacterized protein n=1 Tax=Caenorhabditis auriculariae TaxID=2777116 RepID=A0A8S1H9Z9_9PELO|nr:unnamed protein product [Caenorhabditis auriculariae]
MTKNIYGIITIAALVSLIHCAYSAAQHRFYLRLTEQPFVTLPTDVIVQTLLSLAALIYGAAYIAGSFQYIKKDQHHDRTCDEALNCPSFITFEHRAKAMSPGFYVLNNLRQERNSRTISTGAASSTEGVESKTSPFSENLPKPDFSQLPGARIPKSAAQKTRVLEISQAQADEAFKNCLELVRTRDVDSYMSILMMPKKVQPELIALHAFNVELAMVRDKVDARKGDTTGMYRLQFWRDAISSIYAQSNLPVPRQPVAISLCAFAPNARHQLLQKLVETRQSTIGDRPFTTTKALTDYGRYTTGSLLTLQLEALARHLKIEALPHLDHVCADLGAAFGVANLIRSTLPLLSRGVVLLPSDLMSLHGVTADSIYNKKKPQETKALIKDLVKVADSYLSSARGKTRTVPTALRPALSGVAASTDHILRVLKKKDFDVYSPHLQRRNPLILWRLLARKLTGTF